MVVRSFEAMDYDLDLPSSLLDRDGRFRASESPLVHLFDEEFGSGAARVGEKEFAIWRKKFRDEVCEIPGVGPLIQNIRREHDIERSKTFEFRVSPVEVGGFQVLSGVRFDVCLGVVRGEIQRARIVVGGDGFVSSAFERGDARESDAAPEFDGSLSVEAHLRDVFRQRERARPQVGPVRDALVFLELLLVEEGVGGGGVGYVIKFPSGLDDGLGELCAAPEVREEFVEVRGYQPTGVAVSWDSRVSRSSAARSAML